VGAEPRASAPIRVESTGRRLVAFGALAAYAAGAWAGLLADPPAGRVIVALCITLAGAGALAAIGRARLPRLAGWPLALLVVLTATAAATIAVGLPASFLVPANWGELRGHLDSGLLALGQAAYPYSGGSQWSRLAILGAMPLWLGTAAALAFWPVRGTASVPRTAALMVLVAAYGTGVTVSPPSAPLLNGLILTALVAAWLWLPGLDRRHALTGGGLLLAATLLALPITARLDNHHPWLDYRNWNWTQSALDGGESFKWDHTYGPLDWRRTGQPMLDVTSDAPHYWRTAVLDQFDGFRWHESANSGNGGVELPIPRAGSSFSAQVLPLNHSWIHEINFTVRGLRSPLLVGAGAVIAVHGLPGLAAEGVTGVAPSTSGLVLPTNHPLAAGDSYTVRAYVPNPSAAEMRAAPRAYPGALRPYTTISYPVAGPSGALQGQPQTPDTVRQLDVPLRGEGGGGGVSRALSRTPYGRVYTLAHRLVAGAPTEYAAVKRIEGYLRANYSYSESPPQRAYPLRAFLFRDRIGYCQQFSGAMALMLRMVGIPTRVASGFSPGTPESGTYLVTDFDAHSWDEVYFNHIGWVSFDPTPAAAPAQSRTTGLGLGALSVLSPPGKTPSGPVGGTRKLHGTPPAITPTGSGGTSSVKTAAIALLLVVVAAAAGVAGAFGWRILRYRRLSPAAVADAQLRELAGALARLRSWTGHGATLLVLERRLAMFVGPVAAAYAAKLRAVRYGSSDRRPPTASERRSLRRELTAGSGLRARLLSRLAIPPGGPAAPR
jgi:transglutaminase-like putative cysteine protease